VINDNQRTRAYLRRTSELDSLNITISPATLPQATRRGLRPGHFHGDAAGRTYRCRRRAAGEPDAERVGVCRDAGGFRDVIGDGDGRGPGRLLEVAELPARRQRLPPITINPTTSTRSRRSRCFSRQLNATGRRGYGLELRLRQPSWLSLSLGSPRRYSAGWRGGQELRVQREVTDAAAVRDENVHDRGAGRALPPITIGPDTLPPGENGASLRQQLSASGAPARMTSESSWASPSG